MSNWDRAQAIRSSRNFYGVLKIYDYNPEKEVDHYKLLVNGITTHGLQFMAPNQQLWHTTYYGASSGVGRAIDLLPADRPRRLGFVGLGAGTLASFGRAGDQLKFYDINPAVVALSTDGEFTYLKRTPAKVEIALGDARLMMEREIAELGNLLEHPARPFAAIIGGAKVSGKIKVLEHLMDKVDVLVIGGGMANTFLLAQGHGVGKSLAEPDRVEDARRILAAAERHGVAALFGRRQAIDPAGQHGIDPHRRA